MEELALPAYDDPESSGMFDDYIDMCFQFGYVALFGAAYPLAALFAFINNLVEVSESPAWVSTKYSGIRGLALVELKAAFSVRLSTQVSSILRFLDQ